jgi:hypothetical protein
MDSKNFLAASLMTFALACSGAPFTGPLPEEELPPSGFAGEVPLGSSGSGVTSAGTGSGGGVVTAQGGADQGEGGAAGGEAPVVVGTVSEGGAPAVELALIDDVEGNFPHIPESDGRNGLWYQAQDASGGWLSSFEAAALEDGSHAARFCGSGFTEWGAAMGIMLRSPFEPYDASAYCGVRFRARGNGDGWILRISDRQSEPAGGLCGDQCYQYPGQAFELGEDWQEHEVRFDEIPVDASALYALRFTNEDTSGVEFELVVDDVAFVPLGSCR